MSACKKLTVHAIKSARLLPHEKSKKLFDGDGLFLFISPTGRKYWRLAYRRFGKAQTLSLGEYPHVSLAQAREYTALAKIKIAHGEKPQSKSFSRHIEKSQTFQSIALEFWETKHVRPRTKLTAIKTLKNHLFHEIGDIPISLIDKKTLIAALKKSSSSGATLPRYLKQLASNIFEYAIAHGWIEHNPAASIHSKLVFGDAKPVQHFACLTEQELTPL